MIHISIILSVCTYCTKTHYWYYRSSLKSLYIVYLILGATTFTGFLQEFFQCLRVGHGFLQFNVACKGRFHSRHHRRIPFQFSSNGTIRLKVSNKFSKNDKNITRFFRDVSLHKTLTFDIAAAVIVRNLNTFSVALCFRSRPCSR